MTDNKKNIVAIIPVYSEEGKIGKVISKFQKNYVDEICIVLDNPQDKIRDEIQEAMNSIDVPIKLIENNNRKGIGNAIRLGIIYAIKNKYQNVVVMAGNNKDDPAEIPKFLVELNYKNRDYVQGSRFMWGGYHDNTPLLRIFLIKTYSILWSVLTKSLCTDVTNGFRAYKTSIFKDKRINIWQNWLDGYELEFYINYKVKKLGYKTSEIPVSKIYPGGNESYTKIHPVKNFWNILRPLIYLQFNLKK